MMLFKGWKIHSIQPFEFGGEQKLFVKNILEAQSLQFKFLGQKEDEVSIKS